MIYVLYVMPNAWKVLKYYERRKEIELRLLTAPGYWSAQPYMMERKYAKIWQGLQNQYWFYQYLAFPPPDTFWVQIGGRISPAG